MALFKQAEFARKCGIKKNALSVYVKRKKVKLDENKMIDDADPINAQFIEHCKLIVRKNDDDSSTLSKNETPTLESKETPDKPKKNRNASVEKNENDGKSQMFMKNFETDLEKKEASIAKMRTAQALEEMKLNRMAGKLIDKELAWNLFTQQFKFFSKSFHDGVELILTDLSKKARLNRNDQAELRLSMIKIINQSVDQAVDTGKNHFKSLIQASSK